MTCKPEICKNHHRQSLQNINLKNMTSCKLQELVINPDFHRSKNDYRKEKYTNKGVRLNDNSPQAKQCDKDGKEPEIDKIVFHNELINFILEQSVNHAERIAHERVIIIRRLSRNHQKIYKTCRQRRRYCRSDVLVALADDEREENYQIQAKDRKNVPVAVSDALPARKRKQICLQRKFSPEA